MLKPISITCGDRKVEAFASAENGSYTVYHALPVWTRGHRSLFVDGKRVERVVIYNDADGMTTRFDT